jgi:hypothetical protein
MRANIGDHIILAGKVVDQAVRAGEIVGVAADGGPPFTICWDDGHTSTVFPGSDAVLFPAGGPHSAELVPVPGAGTRREWTVRVSIFEQGDDTTATVALVADSPRALLAAGAARRNPQDTGDTHIGDEVAVARALRRLADSLLETARHDIGTATGSPEVHMARR